MLWKRIFLGISFMLFASMNYDGRGDYDEII